MTFIKKDFIYFYLALFFFTLLLSIDVCAQVPQSINYQAVARDNTGKLISNQNIEVKVGILSNSNTGNLEYEEEFTTTTSAYGLFNLRIGQGSPTANGSVLLFSDIDWGASTYFLKIEIKNTSGVYEDLGTSQMLSVPYALYAKEAQNSINSLTKVSQESAGTNCANGGKKIEVGLDDNRNNILDPAEVDVTYFVCDAKQYKAGQGIIISNDTVINSGDLDSKNELIDSITITNNNLNVYEQGQLSHSISLDTIGKYKRALLQNRINADMDTDSMNERISSFKLVGDSLVIKENDSTFYVSIGNIKSLINQNKNLIVSHIASDMDTDSMNERINSAKLIGDNIVIVEHDSTFNINLNKYNQDKDSTNELISSLQLNSFGDLRINENGHISTVNLAPLSTDSQSLVLSPNKDSLFITGGNSIVLPDYSTTNELIDSIKLIGNNIFVYEAGNVFSANLSVFKNIRGLGKVNRLAYYGASDSITYDNQLSWDNTNKRMGVGVVTPQATIDVLGAVRLRTNIAPAISGMVRWSGSDFEGYDGANWVSLTSGVVSTCPAGMTNVNGKLCIETNERTPATWFNAASTCIAAGYKLPSWSEWYGAVANKVLVGETNNWEWVDEGTLNLATKVGNGSITAVDNDNPNSALVAFRCAMYIK